MTNGPPSCQENIEHLSLLAIDEHLSLLAIEKYRPCKTKIEALLEKINVVHLLLLYP